MTNAQLGAWSLGFRISLVRLYDFANECNELLYQDLSSLVLVDDFELLLV